MQLIIQVEKLIVGNLDSESRRIKKILGLLRLLTLIMVFPACPSSLKLTAQVLGFILTAPSQDLYVLDLHCHDDDGDDDDDD